MADDSAEPDDDPVNEKQLLVDYREAAEDARYRDRMLHTSYYLAIVFFAILIGALVTVGTGESSNPAIIGVIGGFGLLATSTIIVWISNIRGARNASTEYRKGIEDDNDELGSREAWDDRCKTWLERRNPSNLFYLLLALSLLFWAAVLGISVLEVVG